jgi:hypothetical protein
MTRLVFALISLLLLAAPAGAARSEANLERYEWKNRLLLVFAPSQDHTAYQELVQGLNSAEEELADRDLVVFHLFEGKTGYVFGDAIRPESVTTLRERYDPERGGLTLVLIGKDGAEKARQVGDYNLEALFRRIDEMPMRKPEMRRDKNE